MSSALSLLMSLSYLGRPSPPSMERGAIGRGVAAFG
jgi:hypothetical protein